MGVIAFLFCIIVIIYYIITGIISFTSREKYEKDYIDQFESIKMEEIAKVVIYCESTRKGIAYKVVITDKKIINELKDASIIEFGTKIYSGQYDQFYSIYIETKNNKKYMYNFNKSISKKDAPCTKNIRYNGKDYPNPYNDCGQIGIYKNPYILENDLIERPLPSVKVAAYNIRLIKFIEKYADNRPFDGKNKIPFYNKRKLKEMKKKTDYNF